MKKAFWKDKDIEILIGNLLRGGVMLSSCTILLGGILYLFGSGGTRPNYLSFEGLNHSFYSLPQVLNGVARGSGEHIIQLGVLLLIATPVARIIFSIFGFIQEKDRLYIAITIIVLIIILSSMFFGLKA